jgi:hypothetical protein
MNWLTCNMTCKPARQFIALALSALLVSLVGCSSTPPATSGGGGQGGGSGNVANISVDGGPEGNYGNGAFTSVTICVPGSTTQCQTIGGILVDTGSYGLRIEASVLTITPPQQTDSSNNPIVECGIFGSGFTWGPVQTVDMTIAGESASSMPIQVMGSANFPDSDAPGFCTDNGAEVGTSADLNTVESLGANGILGVGNLVQDCGTACTQSGASNPGTYSSCPTASTCVTANEPLASQVVNPVSLFATDNNGVVVELPGFSNGETTTVNGQLIFGIGTETNNGLGNATIYNVDTTFANLSTEFDGVTYTDAAFLDTGSEALFFLDSSVTGLPQCTDDELYCPSGNVNLTANIEGFSNGNSGTVNFTVGNGDDLISGSFNAISILGGLGVDASNNSLYFDWGLPFFYGTNVYVALDGATTPGGTGPYVAY